jgi:hypothetical protein
MRQLRRKNFFVLKVIFSFDLIFSALTPQPKKETEKVQLEEKRQAKKNFSTETKLYIKPARKDSYMNEFPNKVYCSPHKYDILCLVPTEEYKTSEVQFSYFDAATKELIPLNHKGGSLFKTNTSGKAAIEVEVPKVTSIEDEDDENITELLFRVRFTVCSFFHQRRSFFMKVILKNKKTKQEKIIFESPSFKTYARKNELDVDADSDEEVEMVKKKRKISIKPTTENKEPEESKPTTPATPPWLLTKEKISVSPNLTKFLLPISQYVYSSKDFDSMKQNSEGKKVFKFDPSSGTVPKLEFQKSVPIKPQALHAIPPLRSSQPPVKVSLVSIKPKETISSDLKVEHVAPIISNVQSKTTPIIKKKKNDFQTELKSKLVVYNKEERKEAIDRYKIKRSKRDSTKIKYGNRQEIAIKKKRFKGRFVSQNVQEE